MKDRYLIIEQLKFNTFNDSWFVRYSNQTYDQAFEKLVCLEKLKESENKVYYIVNCNHLWSKPMDDETNNEIKPAQETNQDDDNYIPF